MSKDVSPSEQTITKGQCGKLMDVGVDALVKSGLPSEPTQYVLEHESIEIAANLVADIRTRVEARIRATEPHILKRLPFDPEKFIGKGWSVDEQVSKRTGDNLDAGQITRKDYLKKGEPSINGEERLRRIKASGEADLQLDASDCVALYQEDGQKTLRWLYETRGVTWLSCWGTILRDPDGDRSVLCLCRHEDGSWLWDYFWVDHDGWDAGGPAGVLAK
ncbi:MAG: hypothetical protein V1668_00005 [Patescibacteria group bacterium]